MDWADIMARAVVADLEKLQPLPGGLRDRLVELLAIKLRSQWRHRFAQLAFPITPPAAKQAATEERGHGSTAE